MTAAIHPARTTLRSRLARAAPLLAGALATGCAGAGGKGVAPRVEFPSDASLSEIASEPAPDLKELATPESATVTTWKLAGPLPDPGIAASVAADDPLSLALAEKVDRRFSQAMSCYAREFGTFVVEHDLPPSDELRTFMRARCGVLSSSVAEQWSTVQLGGAELPPPETGADNLRGAFETTPEGYDNGAWYGQRGDELLWVTVAGRPDVEIAEYGIQGGDKPRLLLRGRSLRPLEWIRGRITVGDYEVGDCVADPELPTAPPNFALVCPVSPRDEYALIEISGGEPGRVLGQRLYLNMALLGGQADTFHSRVSLDGVTPSDSLLAMINEIRARMGAAPLRESAPQSQVIADLLPHYFAALRADDSALVDKIALGVMAGWRVEGMIAGASFHGYRAAASVPLSQQLADLLALPSYRATLLDSDADVLAMASWGDDEGLDRLGLLSTYDLHAPRDFGPSAAGFLGELDRQRVALGHAPVVRVDGDGPNRIIDDALAKVARGDKRPKDALGEALSALSQRTGRPFYGLMYRASVLDGWRPDFAETILSSREVEAAVRIGFFTPQDGAWGEYLVFLIYAVQ